MALNYKGLVLFTFLCVPSLYAYMQEYMQSTHLLYRTAYLRHTYLKVPYRKRPQWKLFYLCALYPLASHVQAKMVKADQLSQYQFAYQVRVLLEEVANREIGCWKISSKNGVIVKNAKKGERLQFPHTVTIEYRNSALFVNKRKATTGQILVKPVSGFLHAQGTEYAGSFLFMIDKKKAYCMNQLDIESYIGSVLRSESWPGWPIEVNKAFAIACRSYLVSKIAVATRKGLPYHIKNTNIHQTYNGVHTSPELLKAVQETKGLILAHNKKPIEAMFDSCCGGVIPADIAGVDFDKAPYLARRELCDHCKPCKIYHWQAEYTLIDVAHRMRKAGINVHKVDSMEVTKYDKAGLVQEVIVKDGKKKYKLNGKQCYALFDKVNSFCFTIATNKTSILLKGRGYGHHLGICQWGARRMLDQGATYRDILCFYYPGAEFMKLTAST